MKRRYVAPTRADIDAHVFGHPVFAGFGPWLDWCRSEVWPDIDALNAGLSGVCHAHTGKTLRFVAQTPALLRDGLHYESRIHERGEISTRMENWHDLLNAMVWCRYPAIKSALNHRQQHDVQNVGGKQRTPAQYAQTLFDEGGAIVVVHDPALIEHWDQHDWPTLFQSRTWSQGGISVDLFGHALLEHALTPSKLITAKCLVWTGDDQRSASVRTADAIANARCLTDPQELRPLPISGIPGWHAQQDTAFYATADCFRPLREGRRYPPPIR